MPAIDAFNGDADGLCALLQLRSVEPLASELVSGVKRDIQLLRGVEAGEGDRVTALDISMDKNRADVLRLLAAGAAVFYADHHRAGEIPEHPKLCALIDTAPQTCTSLIVNRHLEGACAAWAVVGAYGDNLARPAAALAASLGVVDEERERLARLGVCLNYNGYGATVDDLHHHPAELFRRLSAHPSPQAFLASADGEIYRQLEAGYRDDMARAEAVAAHRQSAGSAVYLLPDAPWARRISGVFANQLANRDPRRAHALLNALADGGWLVSVRAPLDNRRGADELCSRFAGGGGRAAAAGINRLPGERFEAFLEEFAGVYGG